MEPEPAQYPSYTCVGGIMQSVVASELADGAASLDVLLKEVSNHNHDWNEAETRFHIINRLINECFGWPKEEMRLEKAQGREFSDYELGTVPIVIWEAKKEGKSFEIPVRRIGSLIHGLASVMMLSQDCREAIEQVNSYCLSRGVEVAVATNGHQIVAFQADRDLSTKTKSRCVVFSSLDHLRTTFPRAWQLLSPGGMQARSLLILLSKSAAPKPPEKLSAAIPNYPQIREPSDLQRSMIDVAELLLLSVEEQPELEQEFYKHCYCQSGALGQHALISKQMLSARYASLFPDAKDAPSAKPVSAKGNKRQLTPEILAEAISSRPIALVGDVGVGKSSFLKHLMYVSAFAEFQHAIYAYVNLGRQGALSQSINELVLDQIEQALIDKYDIDIIEASFVRAIYKKEIGRFDRSIYGELKDKKPDKYEEALLGMLAEKQSNKSEHLRASIDFLARERRKQIIIALDNADQRSTSIQQEAFVIAQNLAADWRATVFISVRPRTFFLSKRSGALSAYPHRIFTIAPPRLDEAIERRLIFALGIAEGRIQLERLKSISFKLGNVATLIRVLLDSIEKSDAVKLFLENITGGNVRELIQFLAGMFGNPNIDMQGTIIALENTGQYFMPVHEFWKVALKGDYQYFDPEKVLAANLFSVQTDDPREHFVLPMLLGLLDESAPRRTAEGFVDFSIIIEEMQLLGYKPAVVEAGLRIANNKKLVEAPDRVTFEEDEDGLYGVIPTAFRLNTVGAYHLKVWLASFAYLDAVSVDTPIFDETVAAELRQTIRSFGLKDRYARAVRFRDYLSGIWTAMAISPSFFDWESACRTGQDTFKTVAQALARHELAQGH